MSGGLIAEKLNSEQKQSAAEDAHYARVTEKRRLQAVMREHGIPRKLAEKITNHYFQKL